MDIFTDVCYEKLGVSSLSSITDIRQAYVNKMNNLYSLYEKGNNKEDIINKANVIHEYFNFLCHKHNNLQKAFFSKEVFIKGLGCIRLHLSNDFVALLNTYIQQTGNSVCFVDDIIWHNNKRLFKEIKHLMKKYEVTYSMYFYMEGDLRNIIINRHIGNKWHSLFYNVKPSQSEKSTYFRKKYPFSYYKGFIKGYIYSLFLNLKNKLSHIFIRNNNY